MTELTPFVRKRPLASTGHSMAAVGKWNDAHFGTLDATNLGCATEVIIPIRYILPLYYFGP